MPESYNPRFHKDNTITYWHQIHGWIHRVHPLKISAETMETWRGKDKRRRVVMLESLGYVRIRGHWEKRQ